MTGIYTRRAANHVRMASKDSDVPPVLLVPTKPIWAVM